MKKKLYHISLKRVDKFVKGIPASRRLEEDTITPRICLSDELRLCLSAVEWGTAGKDGELDDLISFRDDEIRLIWVYEFEVDNNDLISPQQLYKSNKVIDAEATHEYWYIGEEPLIPVREYLIRVTDYTEDSLFIPSYKLSLLGDENYKKYHDVNNGIYATTINVIEEIEYEEVKYNQEKILYGNSFLMEFKDDISEDIQEIITKAFSEILCPKDNFNEEEEKDYPLKFIFGTNISERELYKQKAIIVKTHNVLTLEKEKLMDVFSKNGLLDVKSTIIKC